jgi:hypothetical protein
LRPQNKRKNGRWTHTIIAIKISASGVIAGLAGSYYASKNGIMSPAIVVKTWHYVVLKMAMTYELNDVTKPSVGAQIKSPQNGRH